MIHIEYKELSWRNLSQKDPRFLPPSQIIPPQIRNVSRYINFPSIDKVQTNNICLSKVNFITQ